MPKISFIIPVYNAEKTLRRCVESILFGQEKDIEVVLIEDCSVDGSWPLCQALEQEYSPVKSLRNPRNNGVSYTRNRGLDTATGQYALFVDSDDWVCGSYAKTLMETYEQYSDMLIACGYLFLDYVSDTRRHYGIRNDGAMLRQVEKENLLELTDEVLLQQLWNKIFDLQIIRKKNIRFDEIISMGEDFQFVIDYLKAANCSGAMVINTPLYYYTRRSGNSLMSQWGDITTLDKSIDRMEQMQEFCGDAAAKAVRDRITAIRNQFVFRIVLDRQLNKSEKLGKIEVVMGDGDAAGHYAEQMKYILRQKLVKARHSLSKQWRRICGKVQFERCRRVIRKADQDLQNTDFSVISQNCIGGVFCHDMGLPFQSPTVNLFIPHPDFIRFVNHLEHYLAMEPEMHWVEEYPVGRLDDIEIHFVHYDNCLEAKNAWERRKQRVRLDRIVVLSTDRDGFTDEVFEMWKQIKYPKVLFTANRQYASNPDSVFFPEYERSGCIQDIILGRRFYKDHKMIARVNSIGSGIQVSHG